MLPTCSPAPRPSPPRPWSSVRAFPDSTPRSCAACRPGRAPSSEPRPMLPRSIACTPGVCRPCRSHPNRRRPWPHSHTRFACPAPPLCRRPGSSPRPSRRRRSPRLHPRLSSLTRRPRAGGSSPSGALPDRPGARRRRSPSPTSSPHAACAPASSMRICAVPPSPWHSASPNHRVASSPPRARPTAASPMPCCRRAPCGGTWPSSPGSPTRRDGPTSARPLCRLRSRDARAPSMPSSSIPVRRHSLPPERGRRATTIRMPALPHAWRLPMSSSRSHAMTSWGLRG